MKNIVAELTANNQVLMRYVNRPNCLPSRNLGDSSLEHDKKRLGELVTKVENINKVLSHGCKEYLHQNYTRLHGCKTGRVCVVITARRPDEGDLFVGRVAYKACKVKPVYEYFDEDSQRLVKSSYRELCEQKSVILDIIKKSQQHKKYVRSWGKPQTPKSFTRNAKQKILESGAVIDKHIGSRNSFEVTLTLPGSGISVYEVVSHWSGYIVNRLTQVIRRAEAKGVKAHWFFVWEHQKRGALHMHWCLATEGHWKVANLLGLELRAKWFELLEELSVKTGIDLFQKGGFSGTWRHSPEVWQARVTRVRKSVAAYFSKYCSKNAESKRYFENRRKSQARLADRSTDNGNESRALSLYPSRYWGSASRTKRLCEQYKVSISFDVSSPREGNWICKAIREWVFDLCGECEEVSRTFKKTCPRSGFIFASGWEQRLWFEADKIDYVLRLFKFIRSVPSRKIDAIGAIVELLAYLRLHLFMSALIDSVGIVVYNRVIRDYLHLCMDAINYEPT